MSPYIKKLYKQRDDILYKIEKYQQKCKHFNVIKEYKGRVGEYDYENWIECECPVCDKKWSEKIKTKCCMIFS